MASRVITVALVGEGTAARRPSAQCNAAHTSMLRWRMRSRAIRTSRGRTYALPCARLLQPAVARAASYGPFCMASTRPTYVDTECTHHAAAACVVVTEIDAPPSSPSPSPSLLVLLVLATSSPLPFVRRAGRESDARSHVRSEGPAEHCVARHRHIVRYGTGASRELSLSLSLGLTVPMFDGALHSITTTIGQDFLRFLKDVQVVCIVYDVQRYANPTPINHQSTPIPPSSKRVSDVGWLIGSLSLLLSLPRDIAVEQERDLCGRRIEVDSIGRERQPARAHHCGRQQVRPRRGRRASGARAPSADAALDAQVSRTPRSTLGGALGLGCRLAQS